VANYKGNVKESTRKKVLKAMETYGYTPDMTARGLKTGRTRTIGVIIPDMSETFFTNVLRGMDETLSAAQYNMLLCISGEDARKEADYLKYFSYSRVDGMVIATVSQEEGLYDSDAAKAEDIVLSITCRTAGGLFPPLSATTRWPVKWRSTIYMGWGIGKSV
jgi:Transcriptional regulators